MPAVRSCCITDPIARAAAALRSTREAIDGQLAGLKALRRGPAKPPKIPPGS
ncbi:MAG: hypothetical protein LC745_06955 [Planctomycetia bacterium]|nr:hypothetical protein [Planctomycetia bacterium]